MLPGSRLFGMKIALLFLALRTTAAFAQPNTCVGLTSVKDGAKPVYPPIAKAAQVGGDVELLVSFKATGKVEAVQTLSGPAMLQQAAVDYAKAWRANKSGSKRTCQVEITYIPPPTAPRCKRGHVSVRHTDPQHVTVKGGGTNCINENAEQA
jgi:TonB family protein